MKRLYYIIIAVGCALGMSCQKDQALLYTDIERIQFGPVPSVYYTSSRMYADTVKNQTFASLGTSILVDTVYFDIYTMGLPKDKDRSFFIQQEQVPGVINAVPGVHYKAFDNPEVSRHYVIKAGTAHSKVPVVLFRDASLKTSTATLKFRLVENGEFALGQQNLLWRKVVFTDKLIQPTKWSGTNQTNYFGAYSETKHRFMINATGEPWDEAFLNEQIFPPSGGDIERLHYLLSVIKSALAAYNNSHPSPMVDENNQAITFP